MPKNAKPRSRCRKKTSVSNEDGEASSVALAAASETEASTSCHPVVANVGSNGDDPVPVAASIASKKKQRAKKTPFSLDVSEEQVMCDFLREHAMIWDIKKVPTAGWTKSRKFGKIKLRLMLFLNDSLNTVFALDWLLLQSWEKVLTKCCFPR